MAAAVSGLSPVIITVRMPIARSWSKRSVMPGLTVSLSRITPSTRGGPPSRRSVTTSGVAPSLRDLLDERAELERHGAAFGLDHPPHALGGALAHRPRRMPSVDGKSIPLIRVWAVNGTSTAPRARRLAEPVPAGRELDDRAALRRLVGEARGQRGLGQLAAR